MRSTSEATTSPTPLLDAASLLPTPAAVVKLSATEGKEAGGGKGSSSGEQGAKKDPGRWSAEEHMLFLQGLQIHGKSWKKISEIVKTRTVVQIRTHAQKYLIKLEKAKKAGHNGVLMMDGKGVHGQNGGEGGEGRKAASSRGSGDKAAKAGTAAGATAAGDEESVTSCSNNSSTKGSELSRRKKNGPSSSSATVVTTTAAPDATLFMAPAALCPESLFPTYPFPAAAFTTTIHEDEEEEQEPVQEPVQEPPLILPAGFPEPPQQPPHQPQQPSGAAAAFVAHAQRASESSSAASSSSCVLRELDSFTMTTTSATTTTSSTTTRRPPRLSGVGGLAVDDVNHVAAAANAAANAAAVAFGMAAMGYVGADGHHHQHQPSLPPPLHAAKRPRHDGLAAAPTSSSAPTMPAAAGAAAAVAGRSGGSSSSMSSTAAALMDASALSASSATAYPASAPLNPLDELLQSLGESCRPGSAASSPSLGPELVDDLLPSMMHDLAAWELAHSSHSSLSLSPASLSSWEEEAAGASCLDPLALGDKDFGAACAVGQHHGVGAARVPGL